MTRLEPLKLIELARQQDESLIEAIIKTGLAPEDLRKILVNLLRERVPVKDILYIFERLSDFARYSQDPDLLSERLRLALGRQIQDYWVKTALLSGREIAVLSLSARWESQLESSLTKTDLGWMFDLPSETLDSLVCATQLSIEKHTQSGEKKPIIRTTPNLRLPLFRLFARFMPDITVVSLAELTEPFKWTQIGEIDQPSEMASQDFTHFHPIPLPELPSCQGLTKPNEIAQVLTSALWRHLERLGIEERSIQLYCNFWFQMIQIAVEQQSEEAAKVGIVLDEVQLFEKTKSFTLGIFHAVLLTNVLGLSWKWETKLLQEIANQLYRWLCRQDKRNKKPIPAKICRAVCSMLWICRRRTTY